jgi:iron complex outermembrane receptor protein
VTVLGSEVIERNNIREVGDLVALSPALSVGFGSQPANFAINMRGIGTFSNGIAVESDVAVVIDDVPAGIQAAAFKDLVDIDRLEVLRGPQSTLFGKSAIAGVLNITTKAPSPALTGMVTAMATDDNETRLGFTVSGPITPSLLFRVTGAHSRFPGLLKNLTGGQAGIGADDVTTPSATTPAEGGLSRNPAREAQHHGAC